VSNESVEHVEVEEHVQHIAALRSHVVERPEVTQAIAEHEVILASLPEHLNPPFIECYQEIECNIPS
jgi:hypothetical protein